MVDGEDIESPSPTRGDVGEGMAIREGVNEGMAIPAVIQDRTHPAVAQDRVHLAVVTAARRGAKVPRGTGNKALGARARVESRS